MPTVVTPKEFFVSERDKMYADWHVAFWRELFSNSLDAGAKRIRVDAEFVYVESGQPLYRVWFADDGCGMTRDTLENVYMRLGASTKGEETGGVGGFGRARILTCFSQEAYWITTGNVMVRGNGSWYEFQEAPRPVNGCVLAIDIAGTEAWFLQSGLRRFLSQSTLSRASIELRLPRQSLTGGEMPMADLLGEEGWLQWKTLFHRGRAIREFEMEGEKWGIVSVNRSEGAHTHRLIVRVNGTSMYDEHIRQPVQITLDLLPEMSRKALTASRDNLRNEFRAEVMQFVQELAVDEKSALRDQRREKRWTMFSGDLGAMVIEGEDDGNRRAPQADSHKPGAASASVYEDWVVPLKKPREPLVPEAPARKSVRSLAGLPHVMVLMDDPTPGQRRASAQYLPANWARADLLGKGDGQQARLLFAAWTESCRQAVKALVRNEKLGSRLEFVTGFVFSSTAGAMHSRIGNREVLLVNPVDEDGKARFRLSDPASRRRLMALAWHEVSHIAESWHCERYARVFTDLVASVSETETDRAMRSAVTDMRAAIRQSRECAAMHLKEGDLAIERQEFVGDEPAPA